MASADHLFGKSVFLLFVAFIFEKCDGNDILGCGGFVKSHVNLDFSKIEIGLYTKQGSLKERTECAPTNGYYFLPLYEKGEYVLKVHPPPGWSFEPSKVDLLVDGVTDKCSTGQDINFAFNGFGITGKVVTAGQSQGPSGISIQLVNDKGEKRETVTTTGGDFHFTPVIPGKYTIKASHPRWKLDPSQAVVQVKEGNTALPVGVLAVKGYDVKGSITSYGHPISGLYVLLYSKEESPKFRVEGCTTSLLQGVPDTPICHTTTDASGEFTFGLVPAGDYRLLALAKSPGQPSVSYNIKPDSVPFQVKHDSLYIKNAFEVTGFTVVGSVLTKTGGEGISGARVIQDGRPIGTTDAKGKFTLPSLQPGVYTLSFKHEQCEFEDFQLTVSPTGPSRAPSGVAARWRTCGNVAPPDARPVALQSQDGATVHVTPDSDGQWCTFLPPGVYTAKVEVSEMEQRDGLQFYPVSQKVSVGLAPVLGVSFSQLKARLRGAVRCSPQSACEALPVTLRPLSPDGGYVGQPLTAHVKEGEYTFEEVLPGSVEVSVPSERLCWAEGRHNVPVQQEIAAVPDFHHTGYVMHIVSSHPIEVEYSGPKSVGVLPVPVGQSAHCVPLAGRYSLTPRGCHRFKPQRIHVDVSADALATAEFVAVAHAVTIKVFSPIPASDVTLRVSSDGGSGEGSVRSVGPLPALDQPGGGYAYEHTLYMADGEIAVVSASSGSLLFSPGEPQQVVGRSQCRLDALSLRARRGLTIGGRTTPSVDGVLITLTSDELKLTQTTGPDGSYSFGPLDAAHTYRVTAEKESYVFGEREENGDIAAHKLAEITVHLTDKDSGVPLQGALVSVSGGSYRRNVASGPTGVLRFTALSPAQYYIKPNMKEYRFAPPHEILHVQEGRTHQVKLQGVRVAWSCVGSVASLGGAGWAGAGLVAVPAHAQPAHCAAEEATTETTGSFRIRGLLPKCIYTLQLKESSSPELHGLKLAKAPPTIEVKDNKDIENVRLIAIQPTQITDTNVLVYTPNIDHYKTLRLTLAAEMTPHTPIYSTKLDPLGYSQTINPGLMYVLPRLPADNKTYILQLESTLSKATHVYGEEVYYFNSDGQFKHFSIDFLPKAKSSEQELRQTSLLVVPLLGMVVFAYMHREQLAGILGELVGLVAKAQPRPQRAQRAPLLDTASIDHIVSTVNAAGKRVSKKKQ